jgi:hypothetical protein
MNRAIEKFVNKGLLRKSDNSEGESSPIYEMDPQDAASLQFYKNSLVNYLWPASLLAAILLKNKDSDLRDKSELIEEFKKLEEIMSKEIVHNPLILTEDTFEKTWRYFVGKGWISENGGLSQEGGEPLDCFSGVTADLLGAYNLVLETATRCEKGSISVKEFTKRVNLLWTTSGDQSNEGAKSLIMNSVTIVNALLRFRELGALRYKPSKKTYEGVSDMERFTELSETLNRITRYKITDPDESS